MQKSGALFVSHSTGMLREMCTAGAVLEGGHLTYFTDIDDAIALHKENMTKKKNNG